MKKADVQIGATYLVKVSGNLVPVKITHEHPNGGWEGRSLKTRKTIRIKSAQRLRRMVSERPQQRKKIVSLTEYEAMADDAINAAEATTNVTVAAKRDTGERAATGGKTRGKLSLLNAAAIVLKASGEPMTCSQIVQKAAETTAWKPGKGLTPANTLSAAMRREIKVKGNASRFRLADRGTFALASKS